MFVLKLILPDHRTMRTPGSTPNVPRLVQDFKGVRSSFWSWSQIRTSACRLAQKLRGARFVVSSWLSDRLSHCRLGRDFKGVRSMLRSWYFFYLSWYFLDLSSSPSLQLCLMSLLSRHGLVRGTRELGNTGICLEGYTTLLLSFLACSLCGSQAIGTPLVSHYEKTSSL